MLIDRYVPAFDASYICEASVAAGPDETYAAARDTNLRDPVIDALFALRELPLQIARRLHGDAPLPEAAPAKMTFGDIAQHLPGWVALAEEPGVELVVGSVGRFWRKDYGGRPVTADQFVTFNEPGYAKVALSLSVRPAGTGTILVYEARTTATDDAARRAFRRYWRVIAPGVAIVMRRALHHIKAEAERRPAVAV